MTDKMRVTTRGLTHIEDRQALSKPTQTNSLLSL
jgi:hypothetical protein